MKLSFTLPSIILSMALLGGATAFAQAGPAPGPPPPPAVRAHHHHSPEHETRKLSRELNLTPDQAARIEPILAARQQSMRALRESGNTDRSQRRQIARSTHGQINAVLSETQRRQLHALRAAHHERRHQAPAPTL